MYVPYKRKFRNPECYKSRDTKLVQNCLKNLILVDFLRKPNHITRTAHNKLCVSLNEPPG